MLGWTILFGLISLSGAVATLAGDPALLFSKITFSKMICLLFATLFLVSLLTLTNRGRAD